CHRCCSITGNSMIERATAGMSKAFGFGLPTRTEMYPHRWDMGLNLGAGSAVIRIGFFWQ
ncbi:unnamed protein product, partial [Ectocarpus sp. 6 AP-2014]